MWYSVWLELCTNLTSGLLQKTHLINCNKWEGSNAVIQTCVLTRSLYFTRPSSQVLRDSTSAMQVKCILLSKKHYVNPGKVTDNRHCNSYIIKVKLEGA